MKRERSTESMALRLGCCGSMISPATDPVGVEIVESLARLGFDYIELSLADLAALPEGAFQALERRVRASGIRCEACNNFFPPSVRLTGKDAAMSTALEYARAALERAGRLGVEVVVFGSAPAKNVPQGFPYAEAWKQLVALLRRLGPIAAEHGITIAIEPISRPESNFINRLVDGLRLAREVRHPNVQVLVDYYHLKRELESPEVILEAGKMLRHVHFASFAGRTFPKVWDAGLMGFFACLERAGYRGRCSVEAGTQNFLTDAAFLARRFSEWKAEGRARFAGSSAGASRPFETTTL